MTLTKPERHSDDKILQQAYARRQDDIHFHNLELQKARLEVEQAKREIQQSKHRAKQMEAEIQALRQQLAAMQANKQS